MIFHLAELSVCVVCSISMSVCMSVCLDVSDIVHEIVCACLPMPMVTLLMLCMAWHGMAWHDSKSDGMEWDGRKLEEGS